MTGDNRFMLLAMACFLIFLASVPLWWSDVFGERKISGPSCLDRMSRGEIVGDECRPEGESGRYSVPR